MANEQIDIKIALEEIGIAVINSLNYNIHNIEKIDSTIILIDDIISHEQNINACEEHFKSSGSNYVLFFLSNIIYNLKTRGELILTPDVLKWLGSVWKNFLTRNKKYQEFFPLYDKYSTILGKYYPDTGAFLSQISNVQQIREDFINSDDPEMKAIKDLERFQQESTDILTSMRPAYFFLIDYYYELEQIKGERSSDAAVLNNMGLKGFGFSKYIFDNITLLNCQSFGLLEAVYLSLKKKKLSKKIVPIDGKKTLLSIQDIYNYYLDKFNITKKELQELRQNS